MMPGHEAKAHTATARTQPHLQHLSAAWSCAGWGDRKGLSSHCDGSGSDPSSLYRDLPVSRDDSGHCCLGS